MVKYLFILKGIKTATIGNADKNEVLIPILKSTAPNALIKDFQSKGFFDAKDVHKKIFDVYFPKYDANNETHQQLAVLCKTCYRIAGQYIQDNSPQQGLSDMHLNKLRLTFKKHLTRKMKEIDALVKKVLCK